MENISKKEVISLIDEEISKCPNHHVLSTLFILKAKVESLKPFTRSIPTIRDHNGKPYNLGANYDDEFEQFKKQFKQ